MLNTNILKTAKNWNYNGTFYRLLFGDTIVNSENAREILTVIIKIIIIYLG